jgi:tetrapyrrole methylase family protein/MazG family protein
MHKITVMGTSDKLKNIKNNDSIKLILRTNISDAAELLKSRGVVFETLDYIYESAQDFDELDSMLAKEVIKKADDSCVTYIVPGSAVAGDGSVREIAACYDLVEIIYGDAPEYTMIAQLTDADVSNGYTVIPAACLEDGMFSPRLPLVVTAVDNQYMLSDLKLFISEEYGDEHEIYIGSAESVKKIKVFEADREGDVDHNTMLYIPPKTTHSRYDSFELKKVFKKLRAPGGCPWDREQTHLSLKRYLLEECAEVIEAIDGGDMYELMDELGDVLLQILFHATIAGERGDFSMRDVEDNLARKLIRRHPHVFAESDAKTPDEVLKQWDEIKHEEKEDKSHAAKLKSVPKSMTALMRTQKVLSRAAKTEFFPKEDGDIKLVCDSLKNNIAALEETKDEKGIDTCSELIGEILFDIANLSRIMKVESELELNAKTNEYIQKFEGIENK